MVSNTNTNIRALVRAFSVLAIFTFTSGWQPSLIAATWPCNHVPEFGGPDNGEYRPELGIYLGLSRYLGDITNKETYFDLSHNLKPAIGFFYRKNFKPNFSWRINALYTALSDKDEYYTSPQWRAVRRFSFYTKLIDFGLQVEWDILGKREQRALDLMTAALDDPLSKKKNAWPFVFGGISGMFSKAKADMYFTSLNANNQVDEIRQDLEKAKNTLFIPTVCAGLGVRFDIRPHLVLSAEVTSHYAFSGYLDGIHRAGNATTNDWMFTGGLSLAWRLSD